MKVCVIVMVLVLFYGSDAYSEVLASSNACVSSVDRTVSNIFNAPQNGMIEGIKLVYKSGQIRCSTPALYTHWGCNFAPTYQDIQVVLHHVIDNVNKYGEEYYPVNGETDNLSFYGDWSTCGGCCSQYATFPGSPTTYRYRLNGYNYDSNELIIMNPKYTVNVSDEFMLQHTEGYIACNGDNDGSTCSEVYFLYKDNCEDLGEIKHINWNKLQNAADNSAEIPYSSFNMSLNRNTLEMTFDIDLEYVGSSYDANTNQYDLGTTYVVGFDSFDTSGDLINKRGNCENRISASFQSGTFDEWWDYSEYPYLTSNDLGSNTYLSYPPPSQHWILSIDPLSCSPINYNAIFSWKELSECNDFNGNDLIHIYDYNTNITLSGTLYVSLVSPYSMSTTDSRMYRTLPLIQQDFEISIIKQINVLSSTGVDLFISSIIGIYEDETNKKYQISVLTQSADYIELTSPNMVLTPFGGPATASITSTTSSCLVASSFTCGQIFTISIEAPITCPPADLSGKYDLLFTVTCPGGEDVCNTFFDDNDGSDIALSVDSNFIDNTCKPQMFEIVFDGNMQFYDDSDFSSVHNEANGNYVIGQDPIYVQVEVNFPDDGSGDNFNIFGVQIDNVFVCTADDAVDLSIDLDQENGAGGCLSSSIDADGPYNIIINGIANTIYSATIISDGNTISNVVRFSFLTFDIGRTKMYIHIQLTLILQNGSRRRLLLSSQSNSNQIRHFIDSAQITNDALTTTQFGNEIDSVSTFAFIVNLIVSAMFFIY